MPTNLPLTEDEAKILKEKLQGSNLDFAMTMLLAFVLFSVMFYLPNRHGKPSTFETYGYIKPIAIVMSVVGVYHYFRHRQDKANLRKDIELNEKALDEKEVFKKEKSSLKKDFHIFVKTGLEKPYMIDYAVSKEDYDKIAIGHKIIIEHAPHSKVVFRVNFNISEP